MPWPKDHKARTRERIVGAAADAFRARGVADVRIEEIMAAAGLTHGGFYAHFASKEELLDAALAHASEETIARLSEPLATAGADERLRAVIDAYLSGEHVGHPEHGCPVAALGPEVARGEGAAKRDLARGLKRRLAWMRELLPARRRGRDDDSELLGVFACMIGGVILARLVPKKDAPAVLAACREFLHRSL